MCSVTVDQSRQRLDIAKCFFPEIGFIELKIEALFQMSDEFHNGKRIQFQSPGKQGGFRLKLRRRQTDCQFLQNHLTNLLDERNKRIHHDAFTNEYNRSDVANGWDGQDSAYMERNA